MEKKILEFVEIWETSKDLTEASTRTGISKDKITHLANNLRLIVPELKRAGYTRRSIDVGALRDLAVRSLGE